MLLPLLMNLGFAASGALAQGTGSSAVMVASDDRERRRREQRLIAHVNAALLPAMQQVWLRH